MRDGLDYYSILGLSRDASPAAIRRSFRDLAKALHPDQNAQGQHNHPAIEFRAVAEAYQTFKDETKRRAYDQSLDGSRELVQQTAPRSGRAFFGGLLVGLAAASFLGWNYYSAVTAPTGAKSQESLAPQFPGKTVEDAAKLAARIPVAPLDPPSTPLSAGIDVMDNDKPAALGGKTAARADDARRVLSLPPAQNKDAQRSLTPQPPSSDHNTLADQNTVAPLTGNITPQLPAERITLTPVAPPMPAPNGLQRSQEGAPSRNRFASSVLALEAASEKDPGSLGAFRLLSLINAASNVEDLESAAAVAHRSQTRNLLANRLSLIKAGRETGGRNSAAAEGQAAGSPVEVLVGSTNVEALHRLIPGRGQVESFTDCAGCPEMVLIPAGSAAVSPRFDLSNRFVDLPERKVVIKTPFAVSKRGISVSSWAVCVEAGVCRPHPFMLLFSAEHPVTRVSWFDAASYASWLSQAVGRHYRLMTETEWEYLKLGAGSGPASWGPPPAGFAVDSLRDGPSAWGVHPMPRGLFEWVQDCWHPSHESGPADSSPWLRGADGDCAYRVARRVSPGQESPVAPRTASRAKEFAETRTPEIGFRVVRDISTAKTAAANQK